MSNNTNTLYIITLNIASFIKKEAKQIYFASLNHFSNPLSSLSSLNLSANFCTTLLPFLYIYYNYIISIDILRK